MFTVISCPTCQHKFTIPEAAMGKRNTCPHCGGLFVAGKSVADADVSMKLQPAAASAGAAGAAGINKTMLGETEPPIKYNCPRCKKALESPAIEARTKKPCPSCGQRLQVPAAPPPVNPPAGLNKTVLGETEGSAQSPGYAAGSPPSSVAGAQVPGFANAPSAAGATAPAPAAIAGLPIKFLAVTAASLVGFIFLTLLFCILIASLGFGENKEVAKAKKDLEDYKKEIQQLMAQGGQKQQGEGEMKRRFEEEDREYQRQKQRNDERRAENDRIKNKALRDQADRELQQEQDDLAAKRRDLDEKSRRAQADAASAALAQQQQLANIQAQANAAAALAAQQRYQWYHYGRYYPYYYP